MADSSEKVSFRVDMQCSSLRAKAFLVFDKGSQPIGRHLANKLPTCCQQSADSWQKIFVKGSKRQSANCRPAVDKQSADCWSTVDRLLVGGAVLHFFRIFFTIQQFTKNFQYVYPQCLCRRKTAK